MTVMARLRFGRMLTAAVMVLGAAPAVLPALAATVPYAPASPSPTVASPPPGEPWWLPVGLRGEAVTTVITDATGISVTASGRALTSTDGGASFQQAALPLPACVACAPDGVDAEVDAGDRRWAIRAGAVLASASGGAWTADPGAPDLGRGAHLIAAPAASAGTVVAVDTSGVVWRRRPAGDWGRSLLLLPRSLAGGAPAITALAAFAQPLTASVYLATDGYSLLFTGDGGDDWIRGGPGLPDHVLALAGDSSRAALYAGTDDGLWVHHLRALPAPPSYPGPDLLVRWLGLLAVTAAAIAAAVVGLAVALR